MSKRPPLSLVPPPVAEESLATPKGPTREELEASFESAAAAFSLSAMEAVCVLGGLASRLPGDREGALMLLEMFVDAKRAELAPRVRLIAKPAKPRKPRRQP